MTKISPDNAEIGIIFSNPTPVTPNTKDEPSASIPINGKMTMAKIKQTAKLCKASPSGFLIGSTKPE